MITVWSKTTINNANLLLKLIYNNLPKWFSITNWYGNC